MRGDVTLFDAMWLIAAATTSSALETAIDRGRKATKFRSVNPKSNL